MSTTATLPRTIDDIRDRNARLGHHFFEPASMRFFASRVLDDVFPAADGSGSYFVTSERFRGFIGCKDGPRRYSVRLALPTGEVRTASEFQAYATARAAKSAAKRLASGLPA